MNVNLLPTRRVLNLKAAICLLAASLALALCSCTAPIGADRVSTRQSYAQVEANALRTGKPSAATVSIVHRFGLNRSEEHTSNSSH